jgi:hypothetical protein
MFKNKLKFKFNSPRNDRLKGRTFLIETYLAEEEYVCITAIGNKNFHNKWMLNSEFQLIKNDMLWDSYSSSQVCKCFRRYKRILRKNPILIGNSQLCSRYYKEGEFGDYYDIISVK